jgi:hypothetical protein
MAALPEREAKAMDCLWRGIRLKEDAAVSGDAGAMREAVDTLASLEHRFPEERAIVAKSLLQLSDCLELTGDTAGAREALARVAAEFSEDDREAAGLASLGLSRIAVHEGRSLAEIGELWSRGVETLSDPEQRAHAWIWHAQVLLQNGDFKGCRERLGRIVESLSPERSPHLLFWAHDLIGISYVAERDWQQADRIIRSFKRALANRIPEEMLDNSITETLLRSRRA